MSVGVDPTPPRELLGLRFLGITHIAVGGLLAGAMAFLFVFLMILGIVRGSPLIPGLPFDWLLLIVFALAGGVGLGVGMLRGRRQAWLACVSLYFSVFLVESLCWIRLGPARAEPLVPENVVSAAVSVITRPPYAPVAVLLGLAGYMYLFLPRVRVRFGIGTTAWGGVLTLHLVLALGSAAAYEWVYVPRQRTARITRIGALHVASDADLDFLLDRLARGTAGERMTAAWAIGQVGRTEALERLAEAASLDENVDVRVTSIASLAAMGGPPVQSRLLVFLSDSNERVRSAALAGIAGLRHPEIVERVGPLVVDESASLHAPAVDILGGTGDPRAVKYLELATSDPDPDVRSRAAFALGKLRQRSSVRAIAELLGDENWEVRANAAQALGMIGDPSSRSSLAPLLDDPHSIVRQTAADALDKLGRPP